MINFASLFNQFRMGGSSISDLIDSPGVTLDRLLDQQSFVNQFKSGNTKVQQFMKYDKYETLVNYITEVGPPQDRKRSYKYPLTASQILSSDNNQTIQFFFGQNPIFVKEQVLQEPQTKKPKSQTQASTKQDKEKANQKVVIKDKLDSEQSVVQAALSEEKNDSSQTQQTSNQQVKITGSMEEQSNSQNETTQQKVIPKIRQIQKQVEPLRHALFSYFKGQVNYTLAGYVSKVFSGTLFAKKPLAVMRFLLDSQRFKLLLNHIQSRSVGQLIVKLLTNQTIELTEQRKIAFELMLEKMSQNAEVPVISNLSTPICQIIQKVAASVKASNEASIQLSHLFFTPAIITRIISNVMSDQQNVSVYNAPILQTYLTNVPLVIPEKSQITEDLKVLLLSFLRKTLQKLKIQRQSRPTLGFGRMKIVEIMSFVLKQNILSARQLAASQIQFFPILFNLCRNYQYNNILHNQVVKIIQIALSQPQNSAFLQSLLKEDVLLQFLISQTEEDQKIRAGLGSQKSRKGYIGHIVSICRKVQQYSNKNESVAKLVQTKQFEKVSRELVNKQIFEYNKTLAGYQMKRGKKHHILFGKQQIISQHVRFLAATPPPTFEAEPELINIEHPDLIQAQKIQMQAAKQQVLETEKVKQQQQNFNPRYFDTHIGYNVDDLMNDL